MSEQREAVIDLTRRLELRRRGESEHVGSVIARVIAELEPLVSAGHRQAETAQAVLETAPELKR